MSINQFCTLFKNSNFCPKSQFWRNSNILTNFSPKFFLTSFLVKSKLSTAKKSKTAVFSRVFTQNNSKIFHGKLKMKILNSMSNQFSRQIISSIVPLFAFFERKTILYFVFWSVFQSWLLKRFCNVGLDFHRFDVATTAHNCRCW